ncbi:hypothetical protein ACFSQ7_14030 [Paenibacillus rhizoplanae]
MRQRFWVLAVLILLLLGFTSNLMTVTVQASPSQAIAIKQAGVKIASALPNPTTAPSNTEVPAERETSWYIPGWVDDMIQKKWMR